MSTITLPNIRVGSDLQVRVRLKDGGVAIDWSTLSNIKACIYSDAQRALAGRCAFSIDEEDNTLLVCTYAANKPQYLGVQRLIIQAKYMGRTKTYDKPVFNFVPRTADQEGTQIIMDDPVVDVEIEVEDVSSSLIERLIAACIKVTEEARDVVDVNRGPEGLSAYEVAVENGFEGTEEEWLLSLQGKSAYEIAVELGYEGTEEQWIASLKGDDGEPGTTPHIGQNGNWFIGDVDTGVAAGGQNGVTPHIGQNGNWFIGDTDTGVLARGTNGVTPHIGDNGHWFIGDTDTNVVAEGQDGAPGQDGSDGNDGTDGITPHIGANRHWFIGETDTGILAEGTDGVTPHIGDNGHWYIGDVDTGVIGEGHDGQDGVGFDDAATPVVTDGTFIIILSNGDQITVDLNHNHPQYPKYVLCETLADYNDIATKDAATLYLIPGEAVYLGDVLIVRSGSPLPYTPVSYIETDGTAYIDTGIKGSAPKSSEMKLTPLSEGAFTTHLGARDGNNRFLLVCQWGNAGGYAYDSHIAFGYGAGANQGLSMAATLSNHTPIVVRTKMAAGSQYLGIKQEGESSYTDTTATQAGTITTALNIYIFASNQDGAVAQHASNGVKVYYCKIFSDTNFTTPVFDGVPCVYNGEYGLWDKVSDTFFGNAAGSGAFTGPQI